jgi:hypothetical protein
MQTPYTFLWLSDQGDVAAIDSAKCSSDAEALGAALALFRDDDVCCRWRDCGRIETYAGARFVQQVQRVAA